MNHFCTITTYDHLYKVFALRDSLLRYDNDTTLHILIVDDKQGALVGDSVKMYTLADLNNDELVKSICTKYAGNKDKLRWSLKPGFLRFLLGKDEITKVIYLDNDLCFFNDYAFLFKDLDNHSFLLTPHYYDRSPNHDQVWLEANFKVGLFNAGFIGVNRNAVETLQWWAECCLYRCTKSALRGTFDDQKYLDLVPVMREDAMILRHQGCNVAEWNRFICLRQVVDGRILINGVWPIVFIHFNNTTIREVLDGNEPKLADFFNQYVQSLMKYKPGIKPDDMYKKRAAMDLIKYAIWRVFTAAGV